MVLWFLMLMGLSVGMAQAQVPEFQTDPVFQAPQPFPQLPPSRPCKQADIVGMWKQMKVFEDPVGPETASMAAQPAQYVMFLSDSTYGRYAGVRGVTSTALFREMLTPKGGAMQYLMDESQISIIYAYQNGVAIDSLACFIVANSNSAFSVGQLLLMPPENPSLASRLVKSYAKIWTPPPGWVKPQ